MPRPLAPTFRLLAIATFAALPFAFVGACTTEVGVTPDCVSDVAANGVNPVDKGCTGFAICAENPGNPSVCCRNADVAGGKGAPYTGDQLAFCLLSYGVGAPTSATSSSSSSSSSSTGTGG
ncbi:MAG: hypothetical protein ABJE95_06195 [Byssovorax sp.]